MSYSSPLSQAATAKHLEQQDALDKSINQPRTFFAYDNLQAIKPTNNYFLDNQGSSATLKGSYPKLPLPTSDLFGSLPTLDLSNLSDHNLDLSAFSPETFSADTLQGFSSTTLSPTSPSKPKRERPRTHTPRPANSFIIYRREKHL